jgi:hypothetical protein
MFGDFFEDCDLKATDRFTTQVSEASVTFDGLRSNEIEPNPAAFDA